MTTKVTKRLIYDKYYHNNLQRLGIIVKSGNSVIFYIRTKARIFLVRRLRKQNKRMENSANKTIVLTNPEDIMKNAAALFPRVKERIDCCADSNAPYSHFIL